ncbi:MAG TPA: MFS transporter, partial [Roseiarcus sp.]
MIDARLETAAGHRIGLLWPQRLGTLSVFLANGLGIGAWAAAIPRVKADLALTDAGLSFALLAFAAGGIVAMPLTGLVAHRLRSGPASIVAGFAFAAAIAAIGFTRSLESLSAIACLAGMTSGVMDVAMNANASDVERRSGRPLMSSFHAAFSLGGASGAILGGWLGERGTALSLLGPALLSSLLVAIAVPFLMREGHGFHGAGFAAPSRRLLPLAALTFVLMATEGSVGDWSGTYLARSGVAV